MKSHIVGAAFLLFGMFAAVLDGQVVVIEKDGKSGPPPGSPEYCAEVEPLRPNLVLTRDTTVRGRLTDPTAAPLKNSPIELRRFVSTDKQETVKKLSTDADGRFDLGKVKRADYRLLLAPRRAYQQPQRLECSGSRCVLETTLLISATDQLAGFCPVR